MVSLFPKFQANESSSIPKLAHNTNFAFTGQKPLTSLSISDKMESSNVIINGKFHKFQAKIELFSELANREKPITNVESSTLEISESGKLAIRESPISVIWKSTNTEKTTEFRFLDYRNLILLSLIGSLLWQSFDFPTDTWLPRMNINKNQSLTSWWSSTDPSPGLYSLRLNPRGYNEFELVYNTSVRYWSTGNWIGTTFASVPQMTMLYIYTFHFAGPFTSSDTRK